MMKPEKTRAGGASHHTSSDSVSESCRQSPPKITSAMLTLGRDGSDFEEGCSERSTNDSKHVDSRPWWDRITNPFKNTDGPSGNFKDQQEVPSATAYSTLEATNQAQAVNESRRDDTAPGNGYASMDGETPQCGGNAASIVALKKNATSLQQSLLLSSRTQQGLVSTDGLLPAEPSSPTAEDLLQQDCSFFYQGMESPNGRPGRRMQRLRALARPSSQLNQQPFEYRDAVDVLAPPVLAHYRARYQQLNQNLEHEHDEPDIHHDLELVADDGIMLTRNNTMTTTVENSSIFYNLHGRVLMALPRDQVRLVMDTDLEAGILSIEQWRQNEKADIGYPDVALQDRPHLRYVLTVHDDLYRRIVSEMSEGLTKPYWGLSGCCNENEKVDIRVAIAVMIVIMTILLINTFIWPVD